MISAGSLSLVQVGGRPCFNFLASTVRPSRGALPCLWTENGLLAASGSGTLPTDVACSVCSDCGFWHIASIAVAEV